LGAEKFLDIKCVYGNLKPKAMVIVATIRALRHHGGAGIDELNTPSLERVEKGFVNLQKHIENAKTFGFHPVIAINHFVKDTQEEIDLLQKLCAEMEVQAVVAKAWELGGNGTQDLARAVVAEIESGNNQFKPLYDYSKSPKEKIEIIAKTIYGAEGVEYSVKALEGLKRIEKIGLSNLPICMAKTQKSFSDNEIEIGRPSGFTVTVREFEISAGAGFLIPILGKIMRMPGLPSVPSSEGMHIDANGVISGLS
jgi:formate--tetrahydrofolate ligase